MAEEDRRILAILDQIAGSHCFLCEQEFPGQEGITVDYHRVGYTICSSCRQSTDDPTLAIKRRLNPVSFWDRLGEI